MMDHQDLPKPLRLRLRSFFLQNRYQAFYLTQQDLLKDSLFLVMMISQVVRRLLWDAARLLNLGHPETSKTMNIYEHHGHLSLIRHLEPEMLGSRSWWTMVNSFRCAEEMSPQLQSEVPGELGEACGDAEGEMILADFDISRHNFELLTPSVFCAEAGLDHSETIHSMTHNTPERYGSDIGNAWNFYCNILRPTCIDLGLLSLQESCMQEAFPKSHQ